MSLICIGITYKIEFPSYPLFSVFLLLALVHFVYSALVHNLLTMVVRKKSISR